MAQGKGELMAWELWWQVTLWMLLGTTCVVGIIGAAKGKGKP